MRSRPMLLKILGAPFGNGMNGQTGSVSGHQSAGLAVLFDASEQVALDFKIFRDHFENPIGIRAPAQIIFEISDADQPRGFRSEKGGGTRFLRGLEARANDAVADLGLLKSEAAFFFVGRQFTGNDVEQRAGDSGIGKVRGDARAHRSGAENRNSLDS